MKFFAFCFALCCAFCAAAADIDFNAYGAGPMLKPAGTFYVAPSGNDKNDGKSESKPKKDITKISTYLAQGYNVKLKRGDTWYLPLGSITINGNPLTGDTVDLAAEAATLAATPKSGAKFVAWTDSDGKLLSTAATYAYTHTKED